MGSSYTGLPATSISPNYRFADVDSDDTVFTMVVLAGIFAQTFADYDGRITDSCHGLDDLAIQW